MPACVKRILAIQDWEGVEVDLRILVEEAFDDEDSEEEAWEEFEAEAHSRPEVE